MGKKQAAARGGPGSLKATPLVRLAEGGGGWRGEFDRRKIMGVAKICHEMITELGHSRKHPICLEVNDKLNSNFISNKVYK